MWRRILFKYIKLFNLNENDEDINSIRAFFQNFSFFTYYQYLQNDLCIQLTSLIEYEKNNNNLDNNYITLITNTLINYTKAIKDIFNDKKIFLKILPNFLRFISQCSILIDSKIKEMNKIIDKKKYIKQSLIDDYKKNVELFNEYFKCEGEFYLNILNNVYEEEKFLIKTDEQKNEFKNLLITLLKALDNTN